MNWPDGRSYDGGWSNDNQNGFGYFTNKNGIKRNGEWVDGNRTKWLGGVDGTRMHTLIDNQFEKVEPVQVVVIQAEEPEAVVTAAPVVDAPNVAEAVEAVVDVGGTK